MYCKTNQIFDIPPFCSHFKHKKNIYLYCLISLTLLMDLGLTWLTDSLAFELGITLIHVNVSFCYFQRIDLYINISLSCLRNVSCTEILVEILGTILIYIKGMP